MTTVDQIREQLERQGGLTAEAMEPLAQAYTQEIERINLRLAQCAQLLRKGLRSEAIQQAGVRPNLFDWSANLDFPEIDDWYEILQFFQVALPPRLNRDAVQQLQEATVEGQPLEELLKQHRRLAIGKAPLSWRLKVLRAISALDETNGVWIEDIEVWEKARLAEIPKELEQANACRDADTCIKLATELTQVNWLLPLPQELTKQVVDTADRLEFDRQAEELDRIGQALYDGFGNRNETECRGLRRRWEAITEQMKFPVPQDVFERTEPALLWLSERDEELRRQQAHLQHVADLVARLDAGKSILEIRKAYQQAKSQGHELERSLESRYRAVCGELALQARRRMVIGIVGIAACTILIAIAFGVWQWQNSRNRELQAGIQSLQQLMNAGKLDEADQYVQSLEATNPSVLASTEMSALISDLNGQIKAEADRVDRFEELISRSDHEDPAQIDLAVLQQAVDIAQSDVERERANLIRTRRINYDQAEAASQFRALNADLLQVSEQIDALKLRAFQDVEDDDFSRLAQRLAELQQQYPKAGPEAEALLKSVHRQLSSLQASVMKRVQRHQAQLAAAARIRDAQSLIELRQAYHSYVSSVPGAPLTVEYQEVLREQTAWEVVDQWNQFLDRLEQNLQGKSTVSPERLLEEFKGIVKKIDHPLAMKRCPNLLSRLEAVARRPKLLDELREKLGNDAIGSFVTLEGKLIDTGERGQRLFAYLNKIDPIRKQLAGARASAQRGINVVSGADGTVSLASFQGVVKVIDEPWGKYQKILSRLTIRSKTILRNWESELLLLVSEIMKAEHVDGAIKEMLISDVLETAMKGSSYLNDTLDLSLLKLRERKIRESAWYEPRTLNPDLEDSIASDLKTELGLAYRGIATMNLQPAQLAAGKLEWVGSLQRDSAGKIEPWLRQKPTASGVLLVAHRQPGAARVQIQVIGKMIGGAPSVQSSPAALLAGRPIFFMPNR